jgi:WD40 repeat protein
LNDAYLARMDDGFRALGIAETSNPGNPGAEKAENLEREPAGFGNETRTTRDRAYVSSAAEEDDDARRETFRSFRVTENVSADRWLRGPVDPAGALVHVSDRPLTCASAAPAGDGVAVGGTDHAVRVVGVAKEDAAAKNRRRDAPAAFFSVATLRGGHGEWVTCVTHDVTNGHVVSGGMDSCVYVWARRHTFRNGRNGSRNGADHATVPTKLEGHGGSVSDVLADDGRVASASYDKTVRLWRLRDGNAGSVGVKTFKKSVGTTATAVATLRGHRAPALRLAARLESGADADVSDVSDGRDDAFGSNAFGLDFASLASGDRGGAVLRWDAASGSLVSSRDAHEGHCTALRWVEGADPNATPLLASGGQDGAARFWDDRQGGRPAAQAPAHARARGTGAVSEIAQCAGSRRVVTAGADGYAAVFDLRAARAETVTSVGVSSEKKRSETSVASVASLSSHALGDFAYSLCVAPGADVAFVGDGAGHVHCVDVAGARTGGIPSVAFALGAHRGATRALVATRDGKLCAAGDDGRVASYAF